MMELKEEIDKSIIIDGDINTPLSTIEPDRKYARIEKKSTKGSNWHLQSTLRNDKCPWNM